MALNKTETYVGVDYYSESERELHFVGVLNSNKRQLSVKITPLFSKCVAFISSPCVRRSSMTQLTLQECKARATSFTVTHCKSHVTENVDGKLCQSDIAASLSSELCVRCRTK